MARQVCITGGDTADAEVEELPLNMIERKKSTSPTSNPSSTGQENQGGGNNASPAPSTGGDNGEQPDMD